MTIPGYKKAGWIHSTNIYEVNLRQYSNAGTINAFLKELPRLREMGVETLWFMPITPISQKHKKGTLGSYYACSDYTSVNPEFGTRDDFKNLVDQAHRMGFKVIMDWVANHTGWDHTWTTEHPDYYLWDSAANDFKRAEGMDDIIELDHNNMNLRNAMIAAMRYWIEEFDIDGFRSDLAFWVTLDFWKEARTELEKKKELFWLGEFDPLDNPEYYEVFDAAYTWTWMHETASFYKGNTTREKLNNILLQYEMVCGNLNIPVWFTANHDENSWNGTEYEKYGDMAKAMAVFIFTRNGIPLIYSGQELPNKKRLKFFDRDAIEWTGNCVLNDFYKVLMSLKKKNPALRAADEASVTTALKVSGNANGLFYLRKNGIDEVLVLLNISNERIQFEITYPQLSGKFINVFNNSDHDLAGERLFEMQPWEFLVFEKENP